MTGRSRARAALPLAAWAGLLCAAAVVATAGTTAAALAALGGLREPAVTALVVGTTAGLLMSVVIVLAAGRVATALRSLHRDALRRVGEPSAPVQRPRSGPALRITRELVELASVLDALHLRVRVADALGERRRLEAATAGAGVFELVSGLVAAEEGARGQLAAELHDTVAQSLMIARGILLRSPFTPEALTSLGDYVEDAEEQLRAVMARTRPPALRDGDLASAVCLLRDDLRARYAMEVHVSWPDAPVPLPLASAVTLYRFFQEALLNVVKHADVDDAHVSLTVEADAVVATVRDEGPGFDLDAVRPDRGRHVGLGLMRERARLSGGTVVVESGPGAGTRLQLRLPRSAAPQPAPRMPGQRAPAPLTPAP